MIYELHRKEDIAKVREIVQAAIVNCELQGDKPGQVFWHAISDNLTDALALLDAGKEVSVVATLGVTKHELSVAWTADGLYDAIKETLSHHRLNHTHDADGDGGYPLVDQLTPRNSKDISLGQDEITHICDAIYNEVLTTLPPQVEQSPQPQGEFVPLSAIRPIAVEAIRAVTGCPDIKGNDKYLVDEIEDVAKHAALLSTPQPQPVPQGEREKALNDELALIESVLKGYPSSMARGDALRALKVVAAALLESPAQPVGERVPLRGEQIYRIALRIAPKFAGLDNVPTWVIPFAKAIERAHGIGAAAQPAEHVHPNDTSPERVAKSSEGEHVAPQPDLAGINAARWKRLCEIEAGRGDATTLLTYIRNPALLDELIVSDRMAAQAGSAA